MIGGRKEGSRTPRTRGVRFWQHLIAARLSSSVLLFIHFIYFYFFFGSVLRVLFGSAVRPPPSLDLPPPACACAWKSGAESKNRQELESNFQVPKL